MVFDGSFLKHIEAKLRIQYGKKSLPMTFLKQHDATVNQNALN